MIIAIDFDGTVVTHDYPNVGQSIGAEEVLKKLVAAGHKLVLNTMRSHMPFEGHDTLQEAIEWFQNNGIELYGVNKTPGQDNWTESPKVYANMYIDDSALGCPKKIQDGKVILDWKTIDDFFTKIDLYKIS